MTKLSEIVARDALHPKPLSFQANIDRRHLLRVVAGLREALLVARIYVSESAAAGNKHAAKDLPRIEAALKGLEE